ncbi:cobalt/nickel transport system ATP-binding protein [Tistlia consotensis]|uniref:ABC transporter ATP-binding protein n=1 Tax=Tistlia consotensis USBA 355 TaxID=560819 RepID=A0A1Y6C0A4_9PROT|nr:ATP-binding cassette domain-containing protein [Tistlia consotensis]SMF28970.1 cobalt/nickel transport system ATP-binding protein [Tistlia consotensis USBA 355]SNR91731.1 cobalt/nickel transport system ATP-binding protein [Tistlia consotensis]
MLELAGVSYSYPGAVRALDGVDLAVRPGEKLAILGANGAGKSTLLLLLNGSLRPAAGEVRLHGAPARYDRAALADWRRAVGLVLQDPDDQLFAATVFEDVSFGPLNQGLGEAEVRERITEALETLRIAELADRPTHMLSFGQRKRVALAGIVAMRPEVLLLDEPGAGLDPLGVAHLMAALDRLSGRGTTIVLTTHDMDLAYGWADRIAIFGEGRVAAAGSADAVFEDADLLKRLHLRRPLVWEVGRLLGSRGLLPDDAPLPRTRRQLLELLQAGDEDAAARLAG